MMPDNDLEMEWLASPGYLTLLDGERVWVEPGDTVEGFEDVWGDVYFTDVTKRVMSG